MFELQTLEAPAGLLTLGDEVEIREIPVGRVIEIQGQAQSKDLLYALLAASLYIDGEPLGTREALLELPGRFTVGIFDGIAICMRLYMLRPKTEGDDAEEGAPEESVPGEA
jgi:hypothetical protein